VDPNVQKKSGQKGELGSAALSKAERGRVSPMVSVVIINQGPDRGLEATIKSLFAQDFVDFELIIVDDSPKEGPAKSILRRWPQAVVLQSRANLGFCRAANMASEMAYGKYLFFLDNNAWLNKTALGKLVEVLEAESGAGIAGPLLLKPDGSLNSIGMKIDRLGRPLPNQEEFPPETEVIENVFFVPGPAMLIEKQLFNSLNGFDEMYFRGLEDADICWRARILGRKVVVNPWSIAFYREDLRAESGYLTHRNSLRMIIKNYGFVRALAGTAGFLRATVQESFRSLVMRRPGAFWQYWRALIWNLAIFPDSIKQRRWVQRRRRQNDDALMKYILSDNQTLDDFTSERAA
jgi:GT2 family glycosyltransferase